MNRPVEEARRVDDVCSGCGLKGLTIAFPVATSRLARTAILCAACLVAIIDKTFETNYGRSVQVGLANRALGASIPKRQRTRP